MNESPRRTRFRRWHTKLGSAVNKQLQAIFFFLLFSSNNAKTFESPHQNPFKPGIRLSMVSSPRLALLLPVSWVSTFPLTPGHDSAALLCQQFSNAWELCGPFFFFAEEKFLSPFSLILLTETTPVFLTAPLLKLPPILLATSGLNTA